VHKVLTTPHEECMRIGTAAADSGDKIFMGRPRSGSGGAWIQ
jgi:hypothetical protein